MKAIVMSCVGAGCIRVGDVVTWRQHNDPEPIFHKRFQLGRLALIIFVSRQKRHGIERCLNVKCDVWWLPKRKSPATGSSLKDSKDCALEKRVEALERDTIKWTDY